MHVGTLKVTLRIPENHSLKGKRRVMHSITSQVRNRFNVSIAEVDDHDLWQSAILGIACVANEQRYVNEVLSKVINVIQSTRCDAELVDYELEILPL